jgi:hypothetical protein
VVSDQWLVISEPPSDPAVIRIRKIRIDPVKYLESMSCGVWVWLDPAKIMEVKDLLVKYYIQKT